MIDETKVTSPTKLLRSQKIIIRKPHIALPNNGQIVILLNIQAGIMLTMACQALQIHSVIMPRVLGLSDGSSVEDVPN